MTETQTVTIPEGATILDVSKVLKPTDPGDHERLSHYVNKADMGRAMLTGEAITALCGKVWVPTRDAKDFPVCPECRDKWESKEDDDLGIPNT